MLPRLYCGEHTCSQFHLPSSNTLLDDVGIIVCRRSSSFRWPMTEQRVTELLGCLHVLLLCIISHKTCISLYDKRLSTILVFV